MRNLGIYIGAVALACMGFVASVATADNANAVIYCSYIGYPAGCVARPGVRLVARPVGARAVTAPRPGNRNGGVNRVGVRR
jgi:hypothetical protein